MPGQAPDPTATPAFLRYGGQTSALLRTQDWANSSLGAPDTWPPAVRAVIGIVLETRFPMFVAWGAELRLIYNDAYAEILGNKHPGALGSRLKDVWAEIWPDLQPLVKATLAGETLYHENLSLTLCRRGFDEPVWFTFSYSPLRDETGAVAGLFCTCSETTAQVQASQRVEEERLRQRRLLQQMPGFATYLAGPEHRFETEARRILEAERNQTAALLRSFIEAVPGVVYAKDREGRMLLANQGTAALIGQPLEVFLGRTDAEFLADPAQAEAIMATDRSIMERDVTERVEETVNLPDGTPAIWLSTKAPFHDASGKVIGLIGTSVDITDRKRAEVALCEALEVKELLLAEMNHRVKNSLQLVSSLLTLQAARAQTEDTRAALDEARGRIGVVARLHQRLYRGEHYDAVDLVSLLHDLCTDTAAALGVDGRIELAFLPEGFEAGLSLPIDRAVPVALIVSELLTNALKYAYPEESPGGLVQVSLRRATGDSGQDGLLVTVEDDGTGLHVDFDPAASKGLGMRVVTTLVRQLRANFSIRLGTKGRGSAFLFWLPNCEVSAS